eukprot:scaffold51555_cov18-Tisochrysis_lutea.AAC.1
MDRPSLVAAARSRDSPEDEKPRKGKKAFPTEQRNLLGSLNFEQRDAATDPCHAIYVKAGMYVLEQDVPSVTEHDGVASTSDIEANVTIKGGHQPGDRQDTYAGCSGWSARNGIFITRALLEQQPFCSDVLEASDPCTAFTYDARA